ncbi:MAG: hypothetical protein ACRD1A_05635 [Terriglobales bacterium]
MKTFVLTVLSLAGLGLTLAAQQLPALFAGMRWRSIGPYRSGNVYAVAGVPGDPTTYYLGLPEGGVWKTTDGGTVWKPIFDQEAVPAIGAVAVADSQPSTIYVATGDPTSWSFTPGEGMFKSTDSGAHWQRIGLDGTDYIPALLVDPHNPQLVLVGAQGPRGGFGARGGATPAAATAAHQGVFRSTDGGASWQQALPGVAVADMAWDSRDPKVVYVAVQRGFFGGGRRGAGGRAAAPQPILYRSSDEGKTWKPLAAAGLPEGLRGLAIAVAAGTHGQRIYMLPSGLAGGRSSGVYRSDDGGATWRLMTTKIGSAGGRIYVAPSNPDEVYLMGTAMYRSLDGARTFTPIKGSPGGDDYRDLWIDPSNPRRLLAGVDQGPAISVDGGETWTPWYNLPNGQFYNVFTDNQFPYRVYGAQQDSGTASVLSRSDYGDIRTRDWYPVSGFEFSYIAPDPLNPRWVYTQGWYRVLRRFDRETGQVAVVYTPKPSDRFTGQPPTVFSPTDPHRLYMAAQYVLATDDGGVHWQQLGGDLTQRPPAALAAGPGRGGRGGRGGAIASLAPSAVEGNVLWAGTSDGLIQLSRDGGQSWSNVSPPQLTARSSVNQLAASQQDAGTVYASVENAGEMQPFLYRTTDFGQHWSEIVNGLPPGVRTRTICTDPKDGNLIFAGTEMGAWVSFDQGNHWQPLQLNLPHTVVSGLTVHGDDLVASTYGRSFWILDDVTPLRQVAAAAAAAQTPYFYQPETAWRVRWSNNHDTPMPPEVPAGQNPPEGAILDYYLPAAASGPVTLTIYDSSGALVREFSNTPPPPDLSPPNVAEYWFKPPAVLATSAGEHRFVWDLRYPIPKALTYSYYGNLLDYTEYTLTWHAVKGDTPRTQPVGPLALPGTYQVKLTIGGKTYTRTLTVENDPRSVASQDDLAAQLQLEQRDMDGLAASYDAHQQIAAATQALDAAIEAAPGNQALVAAARALERALDPLSSGTSATGFGSANRDLARHLQDLEFGDLRPNASAVAAVEANCAQIAAAADTLRQLQQSDFPPMNQQLTAAHRAPLAAITLAASACGQEP